MPWLPIGPRARANCWTPGSCQGMSTRVVGGVRVPSFKQHPRWPFWQSLEESEWREQVRKWAVRGGWLGYFTWNSIHSPAGYPDLVLLKHGRLVVAELKTERGHTTGQQDAWLDGWHLVPCAEVYVWRPHDEDEVRRVLLGEAA